MRYTWIIGATAVAGIAVGALVGCSSSGGESGGGGDVELTVTWWGSEERIAKYEEAFEIFESENEGITVTGVPMDYQAYWTSRSTEAAARTLPDIMQFDPANLTEYANNGLLLDLTDYIGDTIDFSNVSDDVVASGQFGDDTYGLPIGTNSLGVFYNPSLVEQVGMEPPAEGYTWDEFNDWIIEVSKAGEKTEDGQPIFGGLNHGISIWLFLQWYAQQGGEAFPADGELGFGKEDIVEYMSITDGAREEGGFITPQREEQLAPLGGFASGEAATTLAWDNYFGRYAPELGDDVEILPVPSTGDEKAMFSLVSNMAVAANTEHPEEATKLGDFLFRDPRVSEIFGTDRGVNADSETRAAFETEAGSGDAKLLAYEESIEQYKTATAPQVPGGFSTLESEWIRLNEDLSYGNITVDEFADQWLVEAEQAIS